MRKWFRSSSSHHAVTHNDVFQTNASADSDDDTGASPSSPRRRQTEIGDALTSLRNAQQQGIRKLGNVDIPTTMAEYRRNEMVHLLRQRTETVESNLTLCRDALAPDSSIRFEISPDRQIGNALRGAETVTSEWKTIHRQVRQAIRDQENSDDVLQAHPSMRRTDFSGR